MDRENQLHELEMAANSDTSDARENSFLQEMRDQQKLITHSLREEQRLLNSLPGTPPMTFGLGSHVTVKYLGEDLPEFIATIVPDNEIPFFEFDEDYAEKKSKFEQRMRESNKPLDMIKGTPVSVHSPFARAIYGKINGVYRVVVDEVVHNVKVAFC